MATHSALVDLASIPTVAQLYRTRKLLPAETIDPAFPPSQHLNDSVSVIRNDLTKLEVDCIVNAANKSLLGGGGVDGAIHRAAGPGLVKECSGLDGCDTGDAKITQAYNLPCKYVVHTVGPIYHSASRQDATRPEKLLRSCYRTSMELAMQHSLKTIAFPAISTGVYGYPSHLAARAVVHEVRQFLDSHVGQNNALQRVTFSNFEQKDMEAYAKAIAKYLPPTPEDLRIAGEDTT
ncbi:hypothetical protein N7532_002061 [Penicillium argentinense]|uniref:Macro domain-containing protein n=1 Tax=Penicillium argentinense TaxID=1131581 RepID=A0A9W9KN09_9EURO|nr:uncharacterized protein N7532_002061 [Penicillium argentinense]KAJ5111526.1 hypothetical protein N7532_002061 [Penicillium argentinense]